MSSGFSYSGRRPRCFQFWQEFQKCYASADFPEDCRAQVEDYNECLNHKKEIARAQAIREHFAKKQASQLQNQKLEENVTQSGIVNLGLLSRARAEREAQAPQPTQ
ncbi:hypothetical protein O181_043193 [Austropuccinia psidii MF-1]|uniref:NADH dehydrogenase [ubiquinone] iron-sulfur protein 5 n=1 Tax=Austropuccinia psidii MF-1 TaxID=1389203 RepID=A0A9Q3DKU7_9BASI|nr:hypothetical protein [Austropuccinia psidii MF-1]